MSANRNNTIAIQTQTASILRDHSTVVANLVIMEMALFVQISMNVLFLLTTVTKTPLATILMDLFSALVTLDTLEMELFAQM